MKVKLTLAEYVERNRGLIDDDMRRTSPVQAELIPTEWRPTDDERATYVRQTAHMRHAAFRAGVASVFDRASVETLPAAAVPVEERGGPVAPRLDPEVEAARALVRRVLDLEVQASHHHRNPGGLNRTGVAMLDELLRLKTQLRAWAFDGERLTR